MCPNAGLQIPARHQRHGVEVLARSLAELIHRDDVRMVEPSRRPHLPLETLDSLRVAGELRRHRLQRHFPPQTLVLGPVDIGHPTTTEKCDDTVMT